MKKNTKKTFAKPARSYTSAEKYTADVDELAKKNRGSGTLLGFDMSSNLPMILQASSGGRDAMAELPSFTDNQSYNREYTQPQPRVIRDLPTYEPVYQNPYEGLSFPETPQEQPTDDQRRAQDVINIYNNPRTGSYGRSSEELDRIQKATGQAYGIASMSDGGVLYSDNVIRYDDGSVRNYIPSKGAEKAYAIASSADGSIRYSDGSSRRQPTSTEMYTQDTTPQAIASMVGDKWLYSDNMVRNPNVQYVTDRQVIPGVQGEVTYDTLQKALVGDAPVNMVTPYGYSDRYGGYNRGFDLGIAPNTPIRALPGKWEVVKAVTGYTAVGPNHPDGKKQNSGWGNQVVLRNVENGWYQSAEHLTSTDLKVGDIVEGGSIIGQSGNTGNVRGATGNHLSSEIKDPSGKLADPRNYPGFKNEDQVIESIRKVVGQLEPGVPYNEYVSKIYGQQSSGQNSISAQPQYSKDIKAIMSNADGSVGYTDGSKSFSRMPKVAQQRGQQKPNDPVSSLVGAFISMGIDDPKVIAYALATADHESGLQPKSEKMAKRGINAHNDHIADLQANYDGGAEYHGRGFIQLTHKYNYKKYGDMLGVDLVGNPELANDPEIAAQIMALYFKERGVDKLVQSGDLLAARQAIQGTGGSNPRTQQLVKDTANAVASKMSSYEKVASDIINNPVDQNAQQNQQDPVSYDQSGNKSFFDMSFVPKAYASGPQQGRGKVLGASTQAPNPLAGAIASGVSTVADAAQAGREAAGKGVAELGTVTGATPQGWSERIAGDYAGATKEAFETVGQAQKSGQAVNPYRLLAGQALESASSMLGLPETGLSEIVAGSPTARTNVAYASTNKGLSPGPLSGSQYPLIEAGKMAAKQAGSDLGSFVPPIAKKQSSVIPNIKDKLREQLQPGQGLRSIDPSYQQASQSIAGNKKIGERSTEYQAGEGVKKLTQGATNIDRANYRPDLSSIGSKRAVGEKSVSSNISETMDTGTQSLVGENPLNRTKLDNRDLFFKAGGTEMFKDSLVPNAESLTGGRLDLSLFKPTFYQNPDDVAAVFSKTALAKPATDKYKDYMRTVYPVRDNVDRMRRRSEWVEYEDENGNKQREFMQWEEENPDWYQNEYNKEIINSIPSVLASSFTFEAPKVTKTQSNKLGSVAPAQQSLNYTPINANFSSVSRGSVYMPPKNTFSIPQSTGAPNRSVMPISTRSVMPIQGSGMTAAYASNPSNYSPAKPYTPSRSFTPAPKPAPKANYSSASKGGPAYSAPKQASASNRSVAPKPAPAPNRSVAPKPAPAPNRSVAPNRSIAPNRSVAPSKPNVVQKAVSTVKSFVNTAAKNIFKKK